MTAERSQGSPPGASSDDPGDAAATVRRLATTALGARSLQRLTDLATRLLGCDCAQVSLLGEAQTALAGTGLPPGGVGTQLPLTDSLCAVAVATGAPLVVPDAARDERVRDRDPVRSGAVGAYLGIPLRMAGGEIVGVL